MSIWVLNYQCIICKKGSSHNGTGNNNICVVNLVEAENLISWYKVCFLGVVAKVFHEFKTAQLLMLPIVLNQSY
jgi:hypothetical protein